MSVLLSILPSCNYPRGSSSSISDDDEVPPLSSKFGDVYPLSAYEGDCVVSPAVNGLHNDINIEAENAAVKQGVSLVLHLVI